VLIGVEVFVTTGIAKPKRTVFRIQKYLATQLACLKRKLEISLGVVLGYAASSGLPLNLYKNKN